MSAFYNFFLYNSFYDLPSLIMSLIFQIKIKVYYVFEKIIIIIFFINLTKLLLDKIYQRIEILKVLIINP